MPKPKPDYPSMALLIGYVVVIVALWTFVIWVAGAVVDYLT